MPGPTVTFAFRCSGRRRGTRLFYSRSKRSKRAAVRLSLPCQPGANRAGADAWGVRELKKELKSSQTVPFGCIGFHLPVGLLGRTDWALCSPSGFGIRVLRYLELIHVQPSLLRNP